MKVLGKILKRVILFTSCFIAGIFAFYLAFFVAICMYGSYAEKIASM